MHVRILLIIISICNTSRIHFSLWIAKMCILHTPIHILNIKMLRVCYDNIIKNLGTWHILLVGSR